MGRIRLEWDIEAQKIEKSDGEDKQIKWARRRNLFRLFLLIGILLGLVAGGILFVQNRLLEVDQQLDTLLRDTVRAEVAALRIGDFSTFINLQRSATDEWINTQQANYQQYEQLKVGTEIKLTGNVLATEIEGQRGRAIVEEIIDGIPYAKVWFYWRYTDGWRHVPPDLTFWGEEQTLESDHILVRYREVDELFAQQVNENLNQWIADGCAMLQCVDTPKITVDIITDAPDTAIWINEGQWQLLLQSPYVGTTRSDMPFDIQHQIQVATLLAERLINDKTNSMVMTYPNDAYYLRQAVISYMIEQFVQVETNSYLMESIAEQYGKDKIGQLVSIFTPTSTMDIIQQVVPAPLGQANLDWRDFITWRLTIEDELIAQRSENQWLNLYDTSDETVRVNAYNRYNTNIPSQQPVAIEQQVQMSTTGLPQLRVTVRIGSGDTFRDEIVLFNLVNSVWKRAS